MTAVARMTVLHMRTVAPYRTQGLLVAGLMFLVLAHNPSRLIPALALLLAPLIAAQPFVVADKADLQTLYAILPVPRRTVLLAYHTWALASFVTTVVATTTLAVLLARAEGTPIDDRTLTTMLTLSWALFAANIAIQLPLLIRFGYARISILATTIPPALVMVAVFRLHLTLTSVQSWLPLLALSGAAALAASAALAARTPKPKA
jgi:hypothetical protein